MNKRERFIQRKKRVRARVSGSQDRPRLSVFRSNKEIYCQIIDDVKGVTLVASSSLDKEIAKTKEPGLTKAKMVGESLAKKALSKKINKVIFDKSGYKYHGLVKSLAEGAREKGLEF